jgi:hypothetical protein
MDQPKWKHFEELVAKIQADLAGDAIVTHDDRIIGKHTGAERQIDVSIRQHVGQFDILIVIDCKDHNKPLDVKDVEEFIGLVQDVGAHKASMVAAKGFSESAKKRAQSAGVELYVLVDTGDHPWRTGVSVPAVFECLGITEIGVGFQCSSCYVMDGAVKVGDIRVFGLDNKPIGKVITLIRQRWNRGDLPEEPGLHDGIELVPNPVKLGDYQGALHEMRVYASIRVEKRRYFGHLRLTEISGLHNVVTGATVTRRLVTESVGPNIEKTWTRIDSVDDLAVRPVMTFGCADYYETESDLDAYVEG